MRVLSFVANARTSEFNDLLDITIIMISLMKKQLTFFVYLHRCCFFFIILYYFYVFKLYKSKIEVLFSSRGV